MIETQGKTLIIDAGPDFRYQMLKYNPQSRLDAVLLTHAHRDHIAGLDDVRPFNFIQNKPTRIFAEKNVLEAVKKQFFYSFDEENHNKGVPKFDLRQINDTPFYIDDIKIIPIRVYHSMPMLGFRIGNFAYITDAKKIEEKELEKLKGLNVLVINALRRKKHPTHFNLSEALSMIEKLQPKKAFLTHMAHRIGKHSDLLKELPKNIKPAYDGMTIS
jgi:phosphoribosyl 1,2-cyclic phosphate phosphodiesterase